MATRASLNSPDRATLNDALRVLCSHRSGAPARVLVATECLKDDGPISLDKLAHDARPAKALAAALADGSWAVVIVPKLSKALRQALRDAPPGLLICTGELSDADTSANAELGLPCLGPFAQLHLQARAQDVLVGVNADELTGLRRVFGACSLAMSPTPGWLASWLLDDELRGRHALGTIAAAQLSTSHAGATEDWFTWAEQPRAATDLLVPVGVPSLDLDADVDTQARADAWLCVALAHALERRTGPVFPSPRVMVALHQSISHANAELEGGAPDLAVDEAGLPAKAQQAPDAMWAQARRALAREAAAEGVRAPDPLLSLPRGASGSAAASNVASTAPASAFLAQAPLQRWRRNADARHRPPASPRTSDAGLRARALEVLRGSPEWLSEHEAKVVLRGYGFDITRQAVANSASGAAAFADRIGYPVVLKALSASLRRRHELGAIKLDLPNAASVRRGYGEVVAAVEREAPSAQLDGVVVAEMIAPGFELRCGLRRIDADRVLLFAQAAGKGATLEPVLCACPLRPQDALNAAELVLSRLPVHGRRRAQDPRPEDLATELLRLQLMLDDIGPRLLNVDLAPLRLLGGAERPCVVLDASIRQVPHLEGS